MISSPNSTLYLAWLIIIPNSVRILCMKCALCGPFLRHVHCMQLFHMYIYVSCMFAVWWQEWDIDALEESTRYDGFNPTDRVVV